MEVSSNNNSIIIRKLNLTCCLYVCAFILLPYFKSITNQGIFRIVFFIIIGLWLITSLLISRKCFNELLIGSIIASVYFVFMLIYYMFNNSDMALTQFVEPFLLMVFSYMGYFYSNNNSRSESKTILFFIAIFFTVTSITTIYNLINNINVSRILSSSSTDPEFALMLERKNIASYGFIYSLVVIFPILYAIILVSKKGKDIPLLLYSIFALFLSLGVIILSNFTTAYLLLFIALISGLFINRILRLKTIILFAIITIIFYPFIISIIIYVFEFVRDSTPSIMTRDRFDRLINFLQGRNSLTDLSIRFSLLQNSLKSFLQHPFIGIGGYYHNPLIIGNHSQFIDDLGRYGIIGSVPLLIYTIIFFKKIIKNCDNSVSLVKNSVKTSFLLYIILGLLNPVYTLVLVFSVFFLIPILTDYINEKTKKYAIKKGLVL